jgi:dihydrofolate reductase
MDRNPEYLLAAKEILEDDADVPADGLAASQPQFHAYPVKVKRASLLKVHIEQSVRAHPNATATMRRGTTAMELKVNIQVSVDGVYQSNGGRHPDFDPGMERGGWARPLFDDESLAYVGDYYQRADAFLFGRRTYEMFAWSWGTGTWGSDQGDNPISTALNTRPKYVASTTLTDPAWANTTVLSGDLASAIRELKTPPGGELQVHGWQMTSSTSSPCSCAP